MNRWVSVFAAWKLMFPTTSAVSFRYSCFFRHINFVHVYILNAGYLLTFFILWDNMWNISYVAVTTDLYFRHLTENPIQKPHRFQGRGTISAKMLTYLWVLGLLFWRLKSGIMAVAILVFWSQILAYLGVRVGHCYTSIVIDGCHGSDLSITR